MIDWIVGKPFRKRNPSIQRAAQQAYEMGMRPPFKLTVKKKRANL